MQLTIYTNAHRLPEKEYCFKVLLDTFLGISYQVKVAPGVQQYQLEFPGGKRITVLDAFCPDTQEAPISRVVEGLQIAHPFQNDTLLPVICGEPTFSITDDGIHCGIDLFASCFFMLSRWEEWADNTRDEHGRFPYAASHACRNQYIHRALADEYTDLLFSMLQHAGWNSPKKVHRYQLQLSHDVDHPRLWWSAAARLRTLSGSLLKRHNFRETMYWMRHLWQDPFDSFDELMLSAESAGLLAQFNFMGARDQHSDCYYPLEHPFVLQLLERIQARGHRVGFHPSYESHDHPELFQTELNGLQRLVIQPVTSGRQHYLRFSAPETWQRWADAGMVCDSSMGYSEMPGFRCGTCRTFPVFNVQSRQALTLLEQPLIVMDVTLGLYLKKSPEAAYELIQGLKKTVRQHQGVMTILWHNSSLNDYFWRHWRDIYFKCISEEG